MSNICPYCGGEVKKGWKRQVTCEGAFDKLHGVKPEVYKDVKSRDEYLVRLKLGKKEVVITEKMKRGLTDHAVLEFEGKTESFKTVYEAEKRASEILRG